ncbi:MAG: abortive phage resistance protein [Candidatus Wallbacteria bacterium HGW-Wallbacteria-1]|uniref:Abortive phage resistance protein n=1 Tax=Candidatus Wallbacteria bacterium HGW-Wallbacteria-1 TaxID=2013854 RepID=A0A2N1PJG5_9BACT|nr:MAG: abortive phage resistance protein [Candidatus Wallbacteria bacterium HGW-Wallbacteria-1]
MLISFSIENWMSFRNPVTFSMVASRERQHGERVPKIGKYQTRILPLAAIYGGNASGKTNFFKALNFARMLVVNGTLPDALISVEPFRLDGTGLQRPSRFVFELLEDETIYEYSFALTRQAVLEERLVQITSASERVLYDRREGKPNFDDSLASDQFLHFAFKGTRDNQLFLTNSVSQKVDNFRPVYDWFKERLELIAPDSRFEPFEQFLDQGHPLYTTMNEILPQLDTGILHLGFEPIPYESIPLPAPVRTKLQEYVKEGATVRLLSQPGNERVVVTRLNGDLKARKLMTFHSMSNGEKIKFEINQESDGSQRVIDLLPAFLELSAGLSKKVFVIDEIDRSLHTLLTRRLLEIFLSGCTIETRSQLLLTTHDVLLMDQQLLRRDEMWVAERDGAGISNLISFSEYKEIRYDKDIRKSYLQGRLGGIPRILLGDFMASSTGRDSTGASS